SGDEVTLQVFDLSGKLAFEQFMNGTTAYVNVSALPDGLYLVRLTDNQGNSSVQRFVIAH
ncbi:MAG: Secretion system C-terminal sorting domain, partial [Bacteroidota bacterium]